MIRLPSARKASLGISVVVFATVIWVNAGSLTPPGGPVAPTMRTLDEIEPRGIVEKLPTAADAVYVISQPGSYYLTANLTGVAGKNGIRIDADDVTLDLRGFTLRGVSGSSSGIWANGLRKNIAVRNGTVAGWDFRGVDLSFANNTIIEDIRASTNGSDGILAWYSCSIRNCASEGNLGRGFSLHNAASVSNCTAVLNQSDGFLLGNSCTVVNSVAESNGGKGFDGRVFGEATDDADNCTYLNCSASYNSEEGFYGGDANTLTDCAAQNNGGRGMAFLSHLTVSGCSVSNNGSAGLEAWDHVTITDTSVNSNFGIGIYVDSGVVSNCTAHSNVGDGIHAFFHYLSITHSSACFNAGNGIVLKDGSKVENCNASNNDLVGILVDPTTNPISRGCTIRNCLARGNFNDGIQVTSHCLVEGNNSEENGSLGRAGGNGAGIKATGGRNRISGNHVVRNDRGIEVTSTSSTIFQNSASGNTDNYGTIVGGNDQAPTGAAATAGNPWVNLSF